MLLGIALGIGVKLYSNSVWDDAYVFVRYARNLLAHGVVSWNPGGEPTYGCTSPLFLGVVVPVQLALRSDAAVVAAAASLLCGIGFLALLCILLDRALDASTARRFGVFFALGSILWSIGPVAEHFVSGMDTAFALLYMTAYILAAKHYERSPKRASLLLLGVLGGLAFWARPDLMVYSLAVPVVILLHAREALTRRRGWVLLGVTLGTAGALVLVSWLYFSSPLPLSFYAKCGRLYEDAVYEAHRNDPGTELVRYLRSYWPLAAVIAAHLGLVAFRRARRFSPVETGLLAATVLFIAYYARFVLQISAHHQRFYYPTFPVLAFLAAQSVVELLRVLPRGKLLALRRMRGGSAVATVALSLTVLPWIVVQVRHLETARSRAPLFIHNSTREYYRTTWISRTWFRLHEFSDLPDDLVMALTEFGYPAVMNPGKLIVDLTGLNNTEFAHHGFSADVLFGRYRPDLIFMPWRDYDRMLFQIRTHPEFNGYQYYSPGQLGTAMGLALRRSSRHYPQMQEIVRLGREKSRAGP